MRKITNGKELRDEQLDVVSGGVNMLDTIAPIFAAAGIDVYHLPCPSGENPATGEAYIKINGECL